jgi:hypothetical protein
VALPLYTVKLYWVAWVIRVKVNVGVLVVMVPEGALGVGIVVTVKESGEL